MLMAEKDIKNASIIIEEEDLTNIVAFHCQQAIEKYFKAYILAKDKPLLKIHDLPKLYGIIRTITDLKIDEDMLSVVNETYIEDRYPGELGLLPNGMPSIELVKSFLDFTKQIAEKIKKELN
jgi:HEPN domain-containing protein